MEYLKKSTIINKNERLQKSTLKQNLKSHVQLFT